MRIEVHEEAAGAPLLVSFPGGVPAFQLNEMDVVASRLIATKSGGAKTRIKVTLDNLMYEGNDFGENAAKKDVYQYAIGIIRKDDDSKLHIYPAGHPYSLRTKPKTFASKTARSSMTNMERRESLTQEFGSKKKKSQVRAAKSNLISAENISGAKDLRTMVTDNAPEMDEDLLQTAEDVVKRSRIRASRSGKK
jgi:hypothetical protein